MVNGRFAGETERSSSRCRMLIRVLFGFRLRFSLGLSFGRIDMLLRLLLIQIALDGVEDAVDELGGFVSREAAGNFESFVDGDGARCRLVQKLINGKPQNIAIDDRHTRNAPVFRS